MSNSCTQFPLETVIQLVKEAGVELPADASANASSKPSEAAEPDADNLDLVNMPATFDYEGNETWIYAYICIHEYIYTNNKYMHI